MTLREDAPTLKAVARRAGVSLATASLVLNERAGARIAAATRRRVWQAAREVNYRVRQPKRALRLNFLLSALTRETNPFAQLPAFAAAQAEAERQTAQLQVVFAGRALEEQLASLERLAEGGVDGLLLATKLAPEAMARLWELRIPAVRVGSGQSDPHLTSVHSDNYEGMTLLMEHLAGLGHRHIAFCGGNPDLYYEDQRYSVYLSALMRAGEPPHPEWTYWEDRDALGLEAWVTRWFTPRPVGTGRIPFPTAVVADKQEIGRKVLAQLRRLGCRLPEDLSLVVFDDPCHVDPDCPPLTCIRRPVEAIARLAVSRLLEELQKPDLTRVRIILPVEFVVRPSSGPLGIPSSQNP